MPDKPLVSICIPVYNGEKTIEETLCSALSQTYREIEIVITDNCSTDRTIEIIREHDDPRIRLYQNDHNLGMAGNWNKALEYAKGKYVHFLCADDVIDPVCIAEKVRMMEKYEDMNLSMSATAVVNAQNQVLMERHLHKGSCVYAGETFARKSFLFRNMYGEPSSVLIRRSRIDEVGGFSEDLRYCTDWDMWIRISCKGKIGYVDRVLSRYRISSGNETSTLKISGILKDDSRMIQSLSGFDGISFSGWEVAFHRMCFFLRAIARNLYMKFNG